MLLRYQSILTWIFCILIFWAAPHEALAEPGIFTGRSYLNTSVPTSSPLHAAPLQSSVEAWGGWEKHWNEQNFTLINLVARFQAHSEIIPTPTTLGKNEGNFWIRESYHRYTNGGFKIISGQQIVSWGKADGINPTDFLSARDASKLNTNEEVKRIGAPSILVNWIPEEGNSPFGFTFVWNIYHPQSRLLVPSANLPSAVEIVDRQHKQSSLNDSDYALKTSYVGTDWDIDAIFFKGWNHQPFLGPTNPTQPFSLTAETQQMNGVGTNISMTRGAWIYRLESARTFKTKLAEFDGSLSRSQTQVIAGIERKLSNDWRLITSGYFRSNEGWSLRRQPLSPQAELLYQVNRVIQGENVPTRVGLISRLAYDPEESLGWSGETLFVYYGYHENSILIQPKVNYEVNENTKLSVGLTQAKGRQSEPLGFLKVINSYFFEAQYFF